MVDVINFSKICIETPFRFFTLSHPKSMFGLCYNSVNITSFSWSQSFKLTKLPFDQISLYEEFYMKFIDLAIVILVNAISLTLYLMLWLQLYCNLRFFPNKTKQNKIQFYLKPTGKIARKFLPSPSFWEAPTFTSPKICRGKREKTDTSWPDTWER